MDNRRIDNIMNEWQVNELEKVRRLIDLITISVSKIKQSKKTILRSIFMMMVTYSLL